jgi:hypothetical protein
MGKMEHTDGNTRTAQYNSFMMSKLFVEFVSSLTRIKSFIIVHYYFVGDSHESANFSHLVNSELISSALQHNRTLIPPPNPPQSIISQSYLSHYIN